MNVWFVGMVAAAVIWLPRPAIAQAGGSGPAPLLLAIAREVALDPTTYAPALITYGSMRLDWGSSQVFFRNGYVEQHAGYTVSGIGNSASISHRAGNRRLASDSISVLKVSLAHNVAERVVERLLRRQTRHRKLMRIIGHVERVAAASYVSYVMSAQHFRQWRTNERLARELGLR